MKKTITNRKLIKYASQFDRWVQEDMVEQYLHRQAMEWFNKHNATAINSALTKIQALDPEFFSHDEKGYLKDAEGNVMYKPDKDEESYKAALEAILIQEVEVQFL